LKAPLNKTFLAEEQHRLRVYEEYLPALDLKRKQLLTALKNERAELESLCADRNALRSGVGQRLPMLADDQLDLEGLVTVTGVDLGEQNLLGIRLPTLENLALRRRPYGMLMLPHWVDLLADTLTQVLSMDVRMQILQERVRLLDNAARTLTQRVNLFEKVLIPRARSNIRNIRIHLADDARYAAIRAKIAKSKSTVPDPAAEAVP
jgi:V/A-type H+-transporting ATPase subunit D